MLNRKQKILVISNGEAEDAIACQIIKHIQSEHIECIAAPLVSHGGAYLSHGIPICCPTASLPSCGFNNRSIKALKNDIGSGLLPLLIKQYKAIRKSRHDITGVITCGDILPQIMALFTGKPYVCIFTALSEYHIRDQQHHFNPIINKMEKANLWKSSIFTSVDRYIMKLKRCQGVLVRDQLTHHILRKFKVNSSFAGNPMMDDLEETRPFTELNPHQRTLLLLPGSRTPEVYRNLNQMIDVLHHLKAPYNIAVSLASNIDQQKCMDVVKRAPGPIHLLKNSFAPLLNQADAVFAMCGTAAEQATGKGLPVISIPGTGPQFSYKFAEAQKRLLGENYSLITSGVKDAAQTIEQQLNRHNKHQYRAHGIERMGPPGGSEKIAHKIIKLLNLYRTEASNRTKVKETA